MRNIFRSNLLVELKFENDNNTYAGTFNQL